MNVSASFALQPGAPYRLDLTVWALRRRSRNQIDRWDGTYQRALLVDGRAVAVRVGQSGSVWHPRLDVELGGASQHTNAEIAEARFQLTRLLGIDVDLTTFYDRADAQPSSRQLKDRLLGLRPPRFPTVFESLVNAVANQQLSLEVGLTLLNRLTASLGQPVPGCGNLKAFPTPEAVLAASRDDLRQLGYSHRKIESLWRIADAAGSGLLDETQLEQADTAEATRRLTQIKGVGRWSAEYALLRGLGRIDIYPGDDVGARNKLRRFLGLDHDPDYAEIAELLRPWQPCAGMLYFHLLLRGLADNGELTL